MTYEEAVRAIQEHLIQEAEKINSFGSALPDYVNPKVELQIIHESTETHDFGWVFFYNSKKYIETKDISDALGGNAPLIVDNSSQNIIVTGTAHPVSHYVENYIRTGDPNG